MECPQCQAQMVKSNVGWLCPSCGYAKLTTTTGITNTPPKTDPSPPTQSPADTPESLVSPAPIEDQPVNLPAEPDVSAVNQSAPTVTAPMAGGVNPTVREKSRLPIVLAGALVIALIGAAAWAAVGISSHKPKSALNCIPQAASTLDKTDALNAFKSFAGAVKHSDQPCADSLSTSFFVQEQAQAFPSSNGKWITAKQGGRPSVSDRLSKLPSTLSDASFTQLAYTRPIPATAQGTSPTPVEGTTLSYTLDGSDNIQYHLNISFILETGKILVDNLVLVPASLDNQPTGKTQDNSSPLNSQDVKTLAQANVRAIATYLEIIFSDTGHYPSDIEASNFAALGPNTVDQSVFKVPSGTKYVYTPLPAGCSTAAKSCKHFSLSATDASNGSIIFSKSSAN